MAGNNRNNLYQLAVRFRKAIDDAKTAGELECEYEPFRKDRMRKFPNDCCDDTCDLFWHYLFDIHGIVLKQYGAYYAREHTRHNWLETEDGIIIDLTGDQFPHRPAVYVDTDDSFYRLMTDKRFVDVFCIMNDSRLWRDYGVIMDHMK